MENRTAAKEKDLAVVLLSGGMDSTVTAAIAHQSFRLALLHVSYGQRGEVRERRAFDEISDFYAPEHRRVCRLTHLKQIGHSSLTDHRIKIEEADLERQGIPLSYVPFRNAHFLSISVSWGEILGARKIFIGAVEEDSSGYPDCREAYYRAWQTVVELGTKPETHLEVVTPLIHMKKSNIVRRGLELRIPFKLTWSCYRGEEPACGACDSCALRLRAFRVAGVEDPICYSIRPAPAPQASASSQQTGLEPGNKKG